MKRTKFQKQAAKNNQARGKAAETLLAYWIKETQETTDDPYYGKGHEGQVDALTDLLTNLRHFCDMRAIDFYKALDRSYGHYSEEKVEERMAP